MGRPSKYSPEVRERAVRMVLEHAREHPSQWAAMRSVAEKLGCTTETLRRWVRQAERDAGQRPGLTTDERQRLKELERENRRTEARQRDSAEGVRVFCPGGARPPSEVMVALHRRAPGRRMGSSRSARVLPIAPSTYFLHQRAAGGSDAPVGAGAAR